MGFKDHWGLCGGLGVVGDATSQTVAELLSVLWGGPETLIVVSSDLSHFLDYTAGHMAQVVGYGSWMFLE